MTNISRLLWVVTDSTQLFVTAIQRYPHLIQDTIATTNNSRVDANSEYWCPSNKNFMKGVEVYVKIHPATHIYVGMGGANILPADSVDEPDWDGWYKIEADDFDPTLPLEIIYAPRQA